MTTELLYATLKNNLKSDFLCVLSHSVHEMSIRNEWVGVSEINSIPLSSVITDPGSLRIQVFHQTV